MDRGEGKDWLSNCWPVRAMRLAPHFLSQIPTTWCWSRGSVTFNGPRTLEIEKVEKSGRSFPRWPHRNNIKDEEDREWVSSNFSGAPKTTIDRQRGCYNHSLEDWITIYGSLTIRFVLWFCKQVQMVDMIIPNINDKTKAQRVPAARSNRRLVNDLSRILVRCLSLGF